MTPAARGEGDWAVHNSGREGMHTAQLSESLSSRQKHVLLIKEYNLFFSIHYCN